MDWILSEKQLPKPLQRVLVWSKKYHDEPFVGYMRKGQWKDDETCSVIEGEVTHWMPLPEPPHRVKCTKAYSVKCRENKLKTEKFIKQFMLYWIRKKIPALAPIGGSFEISTGHCNDDFLKGLITIRIRVMEPVKEEM